MKIAFFSSEVVPFAKTGGLADVCGALPLALEELGKEVIVVLPLYKCIDKEKFHIEKFESNVWETTIGQNVKVYFLENDHFFDREGLYGDSTGDYIDNLERFQYFCMKSLELIKRLDFNIDIAHCHDWHTALIPVYLKTIFSMDPFFKETRSIFTIHNLAYQGIFPRDQFSKLGLDEQYNNAQGFELYNQINFLKAGILFSDVITTVSETYAEEIQTVQHGCGLDMILSSRSANIIGIINGLDYKIWNPEKDTYLDHKFSVTNLGGKAKNKAKLQKICSLPGKKDIPLFGFVGRLSHQKGIDLIIESIEAMANLNLQFVLLGTGEEKYHQILAETAQKFPKKMSFHLTFDEKIAHQIYAASDIFLMPSIFEPCGLSQMISLRYGTLPLVYKTGGLADTITPFEEQGNGFVFTDYSMTTFMALIEQVIGVYANQKKFTDLRKRAFCSRFLWEDSAKQYLGLYNQCLLW